MIKPFNLNSAFKPYGDQPEAIRRLEEGLEDGLAHQTLLGVTGSGKTFTIANVIDVLQRPTMVLAPNKTLAAQLYCVMNKPFNLNSAFKPYGDQPEAIRRLEEGLEDGLAHQTLLGVTGSGKTFTIANVIDVLQRPTMVLAPNKTLAAQLYCVMKEFFPENAVEYFVSYYDYYKPEAYVPSSDSSN